MSESRRPDPSILRSAVFTHGSDAERREVDPGIKRQILGYSEGLMICRVWFKSGARGLPHTHPHAQVTYVEKGRFLFLVGSRSQEVGAGDCVQIPPGALHGAECLEEGILIDSFSPAREDFLTEIQV